MAVIVKEGQKIESILQVYGLTQKDLAKMVQLKMGQAHPEDLLHENVTIDEAVLDFMKTKEDMSELTLKGYAQDLKQFKSFMTERWDEKGVTDCYMHNITKSDIEIFLNSLVPRRRNGNGKIKPAAQNRKLAVLRGLFQHLVDQDILKKSPASLVEWAKEGSMPIMFLTKEQQDKVLRKALSNRENGLRDFTILFLAFNLGLRLSEIVNLSLHDLFLSKDQILIHGKGDKIRNGIFHKHMLEHVNNYLRFVNYSSVQPQPDEKGIPLFFNKKRSYKGQRITHNAIEKMVSGVFRKCGIEEGSIHRCRHSFAVNCLDAGINIVHIMYLLGHENISTTVRYLRLSNDLVLRQIRDNFPLAYVSIDNFADFLSGKIGTEVKNTIELLREEEEDDDNNNKV